ncbi:alpha/beta fold hydrolase [Nonomuraea soli]|uniref:Proline iminopeptidase n=1 Tax=Nonomuraea soli TaxID=1032476 RepID=A0A7W0CS35_9ACTN|nr:alpha/beta fold hydrolase [Nonomuraea soli]MBA2896296.1 proline iminopeptidase [Nonomuraea soli]
MRALSGLGVLLLAPVLGLATLAGVASITGNPTVYTVAGLAAFCGVFLLGLLLCVPRPWRPVPRAVRALIVLGVAGFAGWQVSVAALNPAARAAALPELAGQQTWELKSGSRLAYVRHAPGRPRPEPVIVLHGRPDLAGLSRTFSSLRADGHAVYLYDRLGTGRSARLTDPAEYGLARDVEDLEEIRQRLGAAKMTLVGHAEGATVAAAYVSAFPGKVARLVLSSPEPLGTRPAMFAHLDGAQSGRLAWSMLHPRSLAIDVLASVDPGAVRSFADDAELDARLDARHRLTAPALHCPGAPAPSAPGGGGFADLLDRPAPRLRGADLPDPATLPVLIVHGSCDRAPTPGDYLAAFPGARVVTVPSAGSAVHEDRPEEYIRALRTFLA